MTPVHQATRLQAARQNASRAYQSGSDRRSLREQEADVFRRMVGALRHARGEADVAVRTRALSDNRRLWTAVTDLVRDPENRLPLALRASIASIGGAVQREMDGPEPDFDFLISVNENLAAGLGA